MLGFSKQASFSRYFKHETGVSPTEFQALDRRLILKPSKDERHGVRVAAVAQNGEHSAWCSLILSHHHIQHHHQHKTYGKTDGAEVGMLT